MAHKAPRVTAKKTYHHGDLRRQLVRAAQRLVARHGAANFKVGEACKLAGVSTAAPYNHFADRDDILAAVAQDGFRRMRQSMLDDMATHPPGSREAICAIGHSYVGFAIAEPHVFRLMFGGDVAGSPSDTVAEPGHSPFDVLTSQVGAFLSLTSSDPLVQRNALALWTFVHGLAALQIERKLGITSVTVDGLIEMAALRMLPAFESPSGKSCS